MGWGPEDVGTQDAGRGSSSFPYKLSNTSKNHYKKQPGLKNRRRAAALQRCVSPCYSPMLSVSPSGQSSLGPGEVCPHAGTEVLQNCLFEPFQGPVNLWEVGQEDQGAQSPAGPAQVLA